MMLKNLFQDSHESTMKWDSTMSQTQDYHASKRQQVFLPILIGLLVLRIPFMAGLIFFNIRWEWTVVIFDIGTYLLTTFLIWWELDRLSDYHLDTLAVMTIILFKPMQTLTLKLWGFDDDLLTFPSPSLIVWFIAIVFMIAIWRNRSKLPGIKPISLGWLLIGMMIGLLTALFLSFPMSLQIPSDQVSRGLSARNALAGIPMTFIYQVGYAAVTEEPLFRGFLWGYLRKLKWNELWIWLFQAGLFMFGHIYYINQHPISFWIIVPVGGLMCGWLAWRSRTIASSMMAHGMMNAGGYVFGYLVALFRFGS